MLVVKQYVLLIIFLYAMSVVSKKDHQGASHKKPAGHLIVVGNGNCQVVLDVAGRVAGSFGIIFLHATASNNGVDASLLLNFANFQDKKNEQQLGLKKGTTKESKKATTAAGIPITKKVVNLQNPSASTSGAKVATSRRSSSKPTSTTSEKIMQKTSISKKTASIAPKTTVAAPTSKASTSLPTPPAKLPNVSVVPQQNTTEQSNLTIYNLTSEEPGLLSNVSNATTAAKSTRDPKAMQQTTKDRTLLWLLLSATIIVMAAQVLFFVLTCGHYILRQKED